MKTLPGVFDQGPPGTGPANANETNALPILEHHSGCKSLNIFIYPFPKNPQ